MIQPCKRLQRPKFFPPPTGANENFNTQKHLFMTKTSQRLGMVASKRTKKQHKKQTPRGIRFSDMPPEKRRALASKGGKACWQNLSEEERRREIRRRWDKIPRKKRQESRSKGGKAFWERVPPEERKRRMAELRKRVSHETRVRAGSAGGRATFAKMSKEAKSSFARRGAETRWRKAKIRFLSEQGLDKWRRLNIADEDLDFVSMGDLRRHLGRGADPKGLLQVLKLISNGKWKASQGKRGT
jgi:hypothetical protein